MDSFGIQIQTVCMELVTKWHGEFKEDQHKEWSLVVFMIKKKSLISFWKDNAKAGDAYNNVDKKLKLFACVDVCTANSNFKFIKGKYPKK